MVVAVVAVEVVYYYYFRIAQGVAKGAAFGPGGRGSCGSSIRHSNLILVPIPAGRPLRLDNDSQITTGPYFVFGGRLRLRADGGVESASSAALGPTSLDMRPPGKPGVHYCKLLSPARAIAYMMTDALKARSSCLGA